jgi:AbrB family looped-hinge helix DNA binding protein
MSTVTISPKYQIVIPINIRKSMKIKPGQKVQVIQFLDRIELIPVKPLSEMRGFLKGLENNFDREDEDRV